MNVNCGWVSMAFQGCHVYARPRHMLLVANEVDAILEKRAGAPDFRKVRMAMQHVAEALIAMEPRGTA